VQALLPRGRAGAHGVRADGRHHRAHVPARQPGAGARQALRRAPRGHIFQRSEREVHLRLLHTLAVSAARVCSAVSCAPGVLLARAWAACGTSEVPSALRAQWT